jgi:hypothetical protein
MQLQPEKSEEWQLLLKAYIQHHTNWQYDTNNATAIPPIDIF